MNGLYIHIPFCKQACHYCNFHFSTQLSYRDEMVKALCKEIEMTKDYFNSNTLDSIYFGGGTPSLLSEKNIVNIFSSIDSVYKYNKSVEVTLETNPDDINDKLLSFLKKHTPVNRFSIGIQSFHDEHLKWMNRSHNAVQSISSIELARNHGFEMITIDLIYGLPGNLPDYWEQNLDTFLELNLPHLSAYCLTIEPKTVLNHKLGKEEFKIPDDGEIFKEFSLLRKKLRSAGYTHYEISNFAKPGFEAIHNSGYWGEMQYLGIGPSAHSFKGNTRRWNINLNHKYMKSLLNDKLVFEYETLSENEVYNEYLMTKLRRINGLNLQDMKEKFSNEEVKYFKISAKKLFDNGLLIQNGESVFFSEDGLFIADNLVSGLFKV